MRALLALVLGALLCAACAPEPSTGDPQFVAHALQFDAPAMAASGENTALVWAGFDAIDVHQDARLLAGDTLRNPVILPLPPEHPFDQRLIAGADGTLHLLWLDGARYGTGNRLYSALLGPDLTVERGPVEVSDAPTYRYSASTDGHGGVWATWSAGSLAEPTLTISRIDVLGRPLPPTGLNRHGEFPALAASTGGAQLLFWRSEGQLWRMKLVNGVPVDTAAVSASVGLRTGDQLDNLWAAPCGSLICVGWNVTRADGRFESWLSSGRADADQWPPPRRLEGLIWLTPDAAARPGNSPLFATAQNADGLVMVTLMDGVVEHVELAVPDVELSGTPGLLRTADEWLLAWAQPGPNAAQLYVARRPLNLPP